MASAVLGKRQRGPELHSVARVEHAKRRACALGPDSSKKRSITVLEDADNGLTQTIAAVPAAASLCHASAEENVDPSHGAAKLAVGSADGLNLYGQAPAQFVDTVDENKVQPTTPSSQRHYDAISSKASVTPRHRIGLVKEPATPETPQSQKASRFSSGCSVFQEARKIFTRGASAGALVGREAERRELHDYVSERVSGKQKGCIYVSGPPGTGKSAFVNEVCRAIVSKCSAKYAYANCMSMKNATDVYMELLCNIDENANVLEDDPRKTLMRMVTDVSAKESLVVVLDEIDQLLNLDVGVLYSIFEMSFQRNSRLVLVGIANALDLTDRFLPRLKARNLKPTLLPFLPYNAPQIASVLSARCKSLLTKDSSAEATFTPLLMQPAITLISKKVASQTGDLRKAFDIAQKVIDLVEAETREKLSRQSVCLPPSPGRTPLGENLILSSPTRSPLKTTQAQTPSRQLGQLTAETAPRASLAHVVRVTAAAFGNGTSQRLKGLNLQQKAILCSLFALEQKKRDELAMPLTPSKTGRGCLTPSRTSNASPTMRTLFEAYTSLCKRDNILHALSVTEFRDVVENLETLSLVSAVDGRNSSFASPSTPSKRGRNAAFGGLVKADDRRFSANVGVQELEAAVEGIGSGILKTILASGSIL